MNCSSKKKGYYSEEEVQEALIRSQIRFSKSATNYYFCIECGEYHLTSSGLASAILSDPKVRNRIKKEQEAQDWEGRFRR